MKDNGWMPIVLAVLGALLLFGGKLNIPWPDIISPTKATAATYVYEKDDTEIPSPVVAALNKLNRERGIIATTFEQDTLDGTGETPEQYKVPLAAAKESGLPSFVVTADKVVLKVVKDPKTDVQILEAVP